MATDVVMPQMGESIAEGTVVRWIKKPGDKVERDEPLLEISTDKVDAEIPSPASGTLTEILAQEGQTVAVNSVVARIATDGEAAAPAAQAAAPPAPSAEKAAAAAPPPPPVPAPEPVPEQANVESLEERRRTKSSPLVRKIARENNIDITQIQGSGVSGRVTKNDILEYIQQPASPPAAAELGAAEAKPRPAAPAFKPGENVRIEPLSVMRKSIAKHMVLSKQTSAHVTTVFEVDFTALDKLRKQYKEAYLERGVKLTYLPFIVQAAIAGLRDFPIINASMDESSVIYHRDYNIGI